MKKNRRFRRVLAMLMAAFVVTTSVFANEMTVEAASKKPTVTLSATSGTIAVGKSTTIKIKKASNKASKKIKDYKFTSSNTKVATVNSKGTITGKKAGSATITMTSKKKVSGKKVTAKYKVTVVKVLSKSISTAKSITVVQGKTTNLKATVLPANADNRGVTYASKSKKIATVDKKGKVKGIKAGNTKITITAKDGKAKATVTVNVIKKNSKDAKKLASKVSFKTTKKTLTVGQTYTQKATVTTKGKNKTVYYQSSNAKVATVDAKSGKVKAVAKGKATITAYATDGSNKSGKYTVTVNPKPQPQPQPKPIAVTRVTISGAPTSAVKANAFVPVQLSATVMPANATNKTVTWSVPANSCVVVNNKGLVSLNSSYNGTGTATAAVTATAGGKTATVIISVVYSENVVINVVNDEVNGTLYGILLDKNAAGYTFTRGGKTGSIAKADMVKDMAALTERLENWDGNITSLNSKIDGYWGKNEGMILELLNAYFMITGDATINETGGAVKIVCDGSGEYTITRGERMIKVTREANSNTTDYVKYNFTIKEDAQNRTVKFSNISSVVSTTDVPGEKSYYMTADVAINNNTSKRVGMGIATRNGTVIEFVVTIDNNEVLYGFGDDAAESGYVFVIHKPSYESMIQDLGVSDFMSDLKIAQNYK